MVRRALALFKACLVAVGCAALVLFYFLSGVPGPPAPPTATLHEEAQQQLLAYLRRPLENATVAVGKSTSLKTASRLYSKMYPQGLKLDDRKISSRNIFFKHCLLEVLLS